MPKHVSEFDALIADLDEFSRRRATSTPRPMPGTPPPSTSNDKQYRRDLGGLAKSLETIAELNRELAANQRRNSPAAVREDAAAQRRATMASLDSTMRRAEAAHAAGTLSREQAERLRMHAGALQDRAHLADRRDLIMKALESPARADRPKWQLDQLSRALAGTNSSISAANGRLATFSRGIA